MKSKDLNLSFFELTPDIVLSCCEAFGYYPTGRLLQLNSYENRVFEIECYKSQTSNEVFNLIGKVYRPYRWSQDALEEEHSFLYELKKNGIPAITPLTNNSNKSLIEVNGLYFTLFPKALGRSPQELFLKDLASVGRILAQIHNIGTQKECSHRPYLTAEQFGDPALEAIDRHIAPELSQRYFTVAEELLDLYEELIHPEDFIRIHGDCHKGNLLQTDPIHGPKQYFFLDFDDFCMGPPEQDMWMLFSNLEQQEFDALTKGYNELRSGEIQTSLFPLLQSLRSIHYAGWIARRWHDPSFQKLFPQYHSFNYWAEETENLEALRVKLNSH